MKTTVVMTTFNGQKYVKAQLESLYTQTYQPDEVIILDDNSEDNTVSIVEKFIRDNALSSWKISVNKENKGWRQNFMCGIWQAKGDLIFPCDQDDIWHHDKIEKMEKVMEENSQINVLVSNHRNFYDDGSKKIMPSKNNGQLEKIPLKNNCMAVIYPGCTYCIRKDLAVKSEMYYRKGYAHDDLMWRLGLFSDGLYVLREDLIDYRQHSDSTYSLETVEMKTISEKKKWIAMTQNFCFDLIRFVQDNNSSNKEKQLRILSGVQEWLDERAKLYERKKIWQAVKLIRYWGYYQRRRQYLGDWYIIFFNRK
ncbi:glycosyltransferase [Ligilactobacillus sp. WILCCON 0076]|uniref:Glycosyltransferase n=1 Tax=Ligilactobacillus ubinensis TaxID=2876789 RepID=A0A9X2FR25_9LACO|nr:glycosyltransferase [Ligilactobacillus ubinensis]MCP0887613.1 glycosyltransferase [Ligilactobacillus ubinensis]